jgi:hypothetical protein
MNRRTVGVCKIVAGSIFWMGSLMLPAVVIMQKGDFLPIIALVIGMISGLVVIHGIQDVVCHNRPRTAR